MAGAAALAAVVGLGYLTVQRHQKLSDQKDKVAAQLVTNARLQKQIDALADVQAKRARLGVVNRQIDALLATDVSWATLLTQIAQKIPENDWMTAFQGSVAGTNAAASGASGVPAPTGTTTTASTASTATTGGATSGSGSSTGVTPAAPAVLSGTLSFTVVGRDFPDVSKWIQSIGEINRTSDLWVPNSTKAQIDSTNIVNFSSTASLTPAAKSDRAATLREWLKGGPQ